MGDWPPADTPIGVLPAFALWLRQTRRTLGLSQNELAKALNVAQPTLQAWEHGRGHPNRSTRPRVAQGFCSLGVPLSEAQLLALRPMETHPVPSATPLGELIRDARRELRICQDVAAEWIGVGPQTLRHWELGTRFPGAPELARAVKVLRIDLDNATRAVLETRYPGRDDRGAWILARAAVVGLGPRGLAAKLGVHRNVVSFWSRGKATVPDRHNPVLVRVLRTSSATLRKLPAQPDTVHIRRGQMLRAVREQTGLTQKSLAQQLGMRQTDWSSFETGRRTLPHGMLTKVLALANAA